MRSLPLIWATAAVLMMAQAGAAEIPFGPVHAGHIESAVEELYEADEERAGRALLELEEQDVYRVEIDVCIDADAYRLNGRATVSVGGRSPEVELRLNRSLGVVSVTTGRGAPVEFTREDSLLTVRPAGVRRGTIDLTIDYGGALEPVDDVWLGDDFVYLGPGALWYPTPRTGDRSEFRIVARYSGGLTSVATGALAGMTPPETVVEDRCALGDVWETRTPVEAAALAVGRLSSSHTVWGDVLLGYHELLRPGEEDRGGSDVSARELKRLARFLESCYGPYPFDWLNVISVPGFDGVSGASSSAPGMAVWDADLVGEGACCDGDGPAASLSRSWWPYSVGSTPLVSEGLAWHSETSVLRESGDEERTVRLRERRLAQYAGALADSGGRAALRGCIDPAGSVDERICGSKGGAVFELLERLIGRDAFCSALTDLSERFRGETAPLREIVRSFEEVSESELDWFAYEWIYRPGLPTYVLDYDIAGDDKGYAISGTIRQNGEIFRTPVPLTIDFGVWSYEEWVPIESPEQSFEFRTEMEPLQVIVDGSGQVPQIGRDELASIHFARGVAASEANEWGVAVDEFGAAAGLVSENAVYRWRYGDALVHSGRLALGLDELESSVKLSPDDPDLLISLARLELRSGRHDAALRHLESYVGLREHDPVGYAQMTVALIELDRLSDAERALAVAGELVADSTAVSADVHEEVHLAEGRFHEAVGDTSAAIEAYRAVLRLNNVSDEARRRLREMSGEAE